MTEVTTRDIYSAILKLHREVEVLKGAKRFISRTQIISEIGENNYNYGKDNGYLTEVKDRPGTQRSSLRESNMNTSLIY